MNTDDAVSEEVLSDHWSQTLVCWNGFLWYFGNTLVSTTLIIYIFFEFCSEGQTWKNLITALLLASPSIIGFIRLLAPKTQIRSMKLPAQSAIWYCLSGAALLAIPCCMLARNDFAFQGLVWLLIAMWGLHHVFEYFGTITLHTWIGNMVPDKSTGSFYARRERYLLGGAITASLIPFVSRYCPMVSDFFKAVNELVPLLLFWALIGSMIIILSNLPLFFCREYRERKPQRQSGPTQGNQQEKRQETVKELRQEKQQEIRLFTPLRYAGFLLFLFYGIAFGFVNGLTQTAQYQVTYKELMISFEFMMVLILLLRLGQWGWSFILGRVANNISTLRWLMAGSQAAVAVGLGILVFTTRQTWFLTILTWIFFSGYSGLNIGVPRYLQYLGRQTNNRPACFSLYQAFSGLAFGITLILSGIVQDRMTSGGFIDTWNLNHSMTFFAMVLLIGTFLRFLLVPLVALSVRKAKDDVTESAPTASEAVCR